MRVGRSAGRTDPGRRRRHNEDAFICEPPLFAVADGMGGAQAGELASRLAAAAVGGAEPGEHTGGERVTALLRDANRSVYERAAGDASVTGMGTTMTVAVVEVDGVWIGHVGDSRAYLLRDGSLDQVTEDHSLVAELVRSGRLTPDEADHHPHRSVITRALGTEPDVDVDTIFVEPRSGDVFLLCSDGLTTMVGSQGILSLIEGSEGDLGAAAQALVNAANAAGGEDNITVVLFEIAEAGEELDEDTGEIALAAGDDEDTMHGVPSPLAAAGTDPHHGDTAPSRGPRSPSRIALAAAGVAVIVLGAVAVIGLARSHFVGAEDDGRVAVYQGLPWELGPGVKLYRIVWKSPLHAASLSQPERRHLFDHDLVSRKVAEARVNAYAQSIVP